ncbi:MAG: PTS sugar transporter subunit IIA [Spirochaetaceae bacterium]|nr:MAG: PTS sugar transporter subunit IIA [Spirochaetaceae bacterium]
MKYCDFLGPQRIIFPAGSDKNEVIFQLAELAAKEGVVQSKDDLAEKLFYREQLMSTGIGIGLGIPHVRYDGILQPFLAMAVRPAGIAGYESMDGIPVRIAIMILLGQGEHKTHVQILSQITRHFKDSQDSGKSLMDRLCAMDNPQQMYELIKKELS